MNQVSWISNKFVVHMDRHQCIRKEERCIHTIQSMTITHGNLYSKPCVLEKMVEYTSRTWALRASLFAILSAFVVELSLGVISNSLALITDSIHALLDCVVTAVLLLAARMAVKPPDAEHTYGHGKIESLGGFCGRG